LYTLTLCKVSNPFDADALWNDRFAGQKNIVNSHGGKHGWKRLQTCLYEHPAFEQAQEQTGKIILENAIFTDVVVWISESLWLHDLTMGGQHIRMLAHNLTKNHREDFAKTLFRERLPRYVVMPSAKLAEDEVQFQFGEAVFVPDENDEMIAKFRLDLSVKQQSGSTKRRWRWTFLSPGGQHLDREIGIYQAQDSLLISVDSLTNPDSDSPLYFRHTEDFLLIRHYAGQYWKCFYKSGKQTYDFTLKEENHLLLFSPPAHLSFAKKPLQMHAVHIQPLLPVQPVADVAPEPPRKPGSETLRHKAVKIKQGAPTNAGYATFGVTLLADQMVSDEAGQFNLVAEGVALPRIDGPYRIQGVETWRLWLDDDGDPVNNPAIDEDYLRQASLFSAVKTQRQLLLRPAGQDSFNPISKLPQSITCRAGSVELIASPFEQWYAFLQFAHPFQFHIEHRRYIIGRHNPESQEQADICLDQISHPRSLIMEKKYTGQNVTFTNLGLSRRHAWVELIDDTLHAGPGGGQMLCYMNADTKDCRCLRRNAKEHFVLNNGDRIIVGNYILRFDSY